MAVGRSTALRVAMAVDVAVTWASGPSGPSFLERFEASAVEVAIVLELERVRYDRDRDVPPRKDGPHRHGSSGTRCHCRPVERRFLRD